MKKLLVLFSMVAFLFVGLANAADTAKTVVAKKDSVSVVIDGNTITVPTDKSKLVIYLFAFLGLISMTVYSTIKGMKNKANGTPTTFDLEFFIKDNGLQKVAGVIGIVVTIQAFFTWPANIWGQILVCALAFVVGVVYELVTDWMKKNNIQIRLKGPQAPVQP